MFTSFLAKIGQIGMVLSRVKDDGTGYYYLTGTDLKFPKFTYRVPSTPGGAFNAKDPLCKLYILNEIWFYLAPVLYAIMAIVGAAGAIYAIVLGVNLAKAEDQSKRDEAKKRLITVLIAVAVTIALALFFSDLLPLILNNFLSVEAV